MNELNTLRKDLDNVDFELIRLIDIKLQLVKSAIESNEVADVSELITKLPEKFYEGLVQNVNYKDEVINIMNEINYLLSEEIENEISKTKFSSTINDLYDVDTKIIKILESRMQIIQEVTDYKFRNNVPVMQYNRIDEMIELRINVTSDYNLSDNYIRKLFIKIIEESCNIQKKTIIDI